MAEMGFRMGNVDALMSLYREEAVEPENTETATELLRSGSECSVIDGGRIHSTRLAANTPNHTVVAADNSDQLAPSRATCLGIFDGHQGNATAHHLAKHLPAAVLGMAERATENDADVPVGIKRAFAAVDRELLEFAHELLHSAVRTVDIVNYASLALSGSCALIALFDPQKRALQVANAGDSRAVLGRWDPRAEKYIAIPLSTIHNGYSRHEVARLRQEHPKEKVINPETGELLGLPVTRAFGLATFKWPADIARFACEKLWTQRPKHVDSPGTPPYLTAEPEIIQTDVHSDGDHPDFLIMVCSMEQSAHKVLRYLLNLGLGKSKSLEILQRPGCCHLRRSVAA
jgi:pyruvate dehydrogenase phosphatase